MPYQDCPGRGCGPDRFVSGGTVVDAPTVEDYPSASDRRRIRVDGLLERFPPNVVENLHTCNVSQKHDYDVL